MIHKTQNSLIKSDKFLVLLIFSFFLSTYLVTSGGHLDNYDGIVEFLKAENFVNTGNLGLNVNSPTAYELGFDIEKHIEIKSTSHANFLYDNNFLNVQENMTRGEFHKQYKNNIDKENYYGPFYLLLPFVSAPLFLLADIVNIPTVNFVPLFLNSIIIAGSCVLVFLLGKHLFKSEQIGFILSLMFGLTSFIWPYITSMFSRPLAILLMLIAIYLIITQKNRKNNLPSLIAGISLGLTVLAHPIFLLILFGIMVYGIIEFRKHKKNLVLFMVGIIVMGSIIAYTNYERFQSPFDFGLNKYQLGPPKDKLSLEGIYGYLISPGKSIIIYLPLIILLPLGLYYLSKKEKGLTILFIYIIFVTYFYKSVLTEWSEFGGQWGPHRFLMPIIPLATLSIGPLLLKYSESLKMKLTVILLSAIGFVVNLLGNLVWIMYAFAYGWEKERLWVYEHTDKIFAWNPYYSPVVQTVKVLSSDWVSQLNPDPTKLSYYKVGLYGCRFDLFFYCEYGLIVVVILLILSSFLAYYILRLLSIRKKAIIE